MIYSIKLPHLYTLLSAPSPPTTCSISHPNFHPLPPLCTINSHYLLHLEPKLPPSPSSLHHHLPLPPPSPTHTSSSQHQNPPSPSSQLQPLPSTLHSAPPPPSPSSQTSFLLLVLRPLFWNIQPNHTPSWFPHPCIPTSPLIHSSPLLHGPLEEGFCCTCALDLAASTFLLLRCSRWCYTSLL